MAGKIPSEIIYEDKNSLAFLDINPAMYGQTVVIPKKHTTSYPAKADGEILCETMLSAKKVIAKIDRTLKSRSCLIIEGFQVDHLHYKIFPTTKTNHFRLGPKKPANLKELEKLAKKISFLDTTKTIC